MTRTTRQALSVLSISVLVAVGLGACTDDEQQAAIARKQRIEQQEAKDQADREAKKAQQVVDATPTETPQPEQTSETPAEPEKVTVYKNGSVTCLCESHDACGQSFWHCDNGMIYSCFHNVIYSTQEVDKTDSNDVFCD